jgi:hypothetical protein
MANPQQAAAAPTILDRANAVPERLKRMKTG